MKIKVAISSNINFYKNTFSLVTNSLIESGIESKDILFVVNAANEEKCVEKNGINQVFVNNCCIELAPLLFVVEKEIESDYWFLMHDTCKVGKNFKNLLHNIPNSKPDVLAVRPFPSMNIGSYKYDFLLRNKAKLKSIRESNFSSERISYWKNWGVNNEDCFSWKGNGKTVVYNSTEKREIIENDNWFDTETTRRTEYYYSLDFYKNKSNWGQSKNYTTSL